MHTFIIRRFLISIPVILLITMIMYLIVNLAPGDPIDMLVGQQALTPSEIEQIRISLCGEISGFLIWTINPSWIVLRSGWFPPSP
jgi:ABC-type dipeptide/oligopeptide/nickel transport system permease component